MKTVATQSANQTNTSSTTSVVNINPDDVLRKASQLRPEDNFD